MKTKVLTALLSITIMSVGGQALAQQFEAVHAINYTSSEQASNALGTLMKDDAVKGATVTLYARDFGSSPASFLVVEDFDDYNDYARSTEKRLASHGWSRYLLAADGSEYLGSQMVKVVDDHGAARHTAGYLVAYLIHTTDPATYRSAIADLDDAIGNPGVLRLVAMRTGDMAHTHAVLIGGEDFKAVNEYLDKMFASDAFATFAAKVGSTRKVVGVDMYRRVASWGD
jgi:hypothetical protein